MRFFVHFIPLLFGPIVFGTGTVEMRLLGTSDYQDHSLPTRKITVGPDVLDGILQYEDQVLDLDAITGLSDTVTVPLAGGVVDIFVQVEVFGATDGIFGVIATFPTDDLLILSLMEYDIPFLDAPGRMATFAGMPAHIPQERRMAGPLTTVDAGLFYQTVTALFPASDGTIMFLETLSQAGIVGDGITGGDDQQTFGLGLLGQGQDVGPTIIGHFRVQVPALGTKSDELKHEVFVWPEFAALYLEDAMFPVPPDPVLGIDIKKADEAFGFPLLIEQTGGSFDFDGDGDVDLSDFNTFQLCFGGDGTGNCVEADGDEDGDVDLVDFEQFQILFTGAM